MIWYDNGPWKRSLLTRDQIPHNFPTPRTDFLMQYIDYRVPPDRISDVAIFDGSVIVESHRRRGRGARGWALDVHSGQCRMR